MREERTGRGVFKTRTTVGIIRRGRSRRKGRRGKTSSGRQRHKLAGSLKISKVEDK